MDNSQNVDDLINQIESTSFIKQINNINLFFDLFLNLKDDEKNLFLRLLSNSSNINLDFFPNFIMLIYQNNKEDLKLVHPDTIVFTFVSFQNFFYEFIGLLFKSDYDFSIFTQRFINNKHPSTVEFIKNTMNYLDSMKNIENF